MLSQWWNRFLASDPSLRRLRGAVRVLLSVALTLGANLPLLSMWGQPAPMAMIGAVVAINGSMGVSETERGAQLLTFALLPLPVVAALVLSITTQPLPLVHSLLFLVVSFAAVYVRRFGARYFPLGMVAFMGYFFAMFLKPQMAQLPALVVAVVVGAAAAAVLKLVVLRDDPEGILDRGRRTLRAQVHGLLHAVHDVAEHPGSESRRRKLHNHSVRLNETALMLENTIGRLDALPESRRELLRQRVLDVELAAENMVTRLLRLVDHPSGGGEVGHAVGALLEVLESPHAEIHEVTRQVSEQVEQRGSVQLAMAIRRLGSALAELAGATGELGEQQVDEDEVEPADEQDADEDTGTGLNRPEVRTAIQVTVAAGLAILFGQLVSPNRWYWAVITAFVVFITTNSRGELLVRAWQRTLGTLLGVLAGILVAVNITGDLGAEIAVILLCVFLAFYFVGYSYAAMTFFITTMLGVLYGMLGVFTFSVLGLRLVETLIGAASGALAAAVVLPTRTRELVRDNTAEFLGALRDFLRGAGTELAERGTATGLQEPIRTLDDALHKVLASSRPLTLYRLRSRQSQVQRMALKLSGCAYYARNVVVALSQATPMVDADTRQRLAELMNALADAAEGLNDRNRETFDEAMAAAQRTSDALHDIAESLTDGPTSLHRTITWLDRVTQVIDDLARELALEPHSAHSAA
ncbi:FUSC family protein [Saccharopolyspora griseoalba]|uniref:FUSC family protein n=1 Tax=Saccharopolyspora griseoalba TaxID=1431848 RepID=A0ABW2LER8_9PSEU